MVVVMLGVAAGLVVPRLAPASARSMDAELDAIASVLTAVAQRDAVSSQRLAIEYDPEENEIAVLVFQKSAGAGNDEESNWRRDPFLGTLRLGGTSIGRAFVGGVRYDEEPFRIDLAPGTPRPDIALVVVPAGETVFGDEVYRVELNASAIDAEVLSARPGGDSAEVEDGSTPSRVDLDDMGLSEEPW